MVETNRKNNMVLWTVVAGMFLWSFGAGIVNISLPTIAQYLDISTSTVSWVIIGHLLILVSLLLIFGRLADYLGQRTIFMWGVLVFTISSYLCGLSLDFNSLITFRLLQGVGSAMLLAVSPALITVTSNSQKRGRAFGYISLATTLGLSTGYLAGGLVTEYLGWNWVFFLNLPLGVLVIIMSHLYLPDISTSAGKGQFDFLGAFLSFTFFLSLVLTLETLEINPYPVMGFLLTALLGLFFIYWELRHPHPLLNLRLFLNPHLSLSILTGFLTTLVLTGTIFLVPFYLKLVKSYPTGLAGLLVFASTLLVLLVGPLSGRITDRLGAKLVNTVGALILLGSLVLLSLLDQSVGLVFIFLALAVRALSDGISNPANSKMVTSHSPPGMESSVSSLLNTARYLGLVMGVVVFETIFNSTISHYSQSLEASTQGALELTLPAAALVNGFQVAFYIGVGISFLIILFTILGRENREVL